MTSNSPPEEQNKLSVYHINTASYSGADFNNPACPCAAWRRWSPRCLEEQGSNHMLLACPVRKAVSAGKSLQLKQDEERGYPKCPWWSQSDLVQHPGWLMAGKSAHQEGKEEVVSSLHILLGFPETKIASGPQDTTVADGHRICLVLLNSFVLFLGSTHCKTELLEKVIFHFL